MTDIEFSLIVPTYNERENIEPLVAEVSRHLDVNRSEIIFVDDGSPDGTADVVRSVSDRSPYVRLVQRSGERGLSVSVIDGFKAARGAYIGVMDGDLSHDPAILPQLLDALRRGADLAVGSRRVKGGGADHWPMHRRLFSSVATWMARLWIHADVRDPMSGYFVATRSLIEQVTPTLNPKGYKILLEIVARSQADNIVEVPFIFRDRRQGYSKLSGKIARQYVRMLWDLRTFSRPLHRLRYTYHMGRYRRLKRLLPEGKTLDIGCGRPCETMRDQAFLRFLKRPGAVGIDIKPSLGPYEFKIGDIQALPFPDNSFDAIVAGEVIEHVDDPDKALQEIRRVLRPNGALVASTPDCHPIWNKFWDWWSSAIGQMWHEAHHVERRRDEWVEFFSRYFKVEKVDSHWIFNVVLLCRKTDKSPL